MPVEEVVSDEEIDAAIAHYREHGYARLPRAALGVVDGLRERVEAIARGRIVYEGMFFQRDAPTGRYEDLSFGKGWEGPDAEYRKIEKLELDPLFWAWINGDLARRIAARVIPGPTVIYRAAIFSKAPRVGSDLPYHQDGGRFWGLSREPELQIWTALDDAPVEAGALVVVPGSHKAGLVTPLGGVVPPDRIGDAESRAIAVPARAGDLMLVHNHLWHRSGANTTEQPRRALTVCYMPASTRCLRRKRAPRQFVPVF